jgi:Alcohol dehydrogenase GroES-like domain
MKAIGVMTFGGPEVLHVVELPEPHAGAGEVRIRVHAASVNPTDTLFRAGSQAARLSGRPAPYVPGMDVAGVIDELGADTDNRLKVGDRVVALVIPAGPRGGAYAEYVVVPAPSVVLAPAGVDFPAASRSSRTPHAPTKRSYIPSGLTTSLTEAIPSPNVFAPSSRKGFPAWPMVQGSITWRCPLSPMAARWPSFSDGTDRPSVTSPCTKFHRPPSRQTRPCSTS